MKVVIIDDEPHIIKITSHYLKEIDYIEIEGTANNIPDAVSLINTKQPDILFLDIELRDGLSFEILKQIEYQSYKVIFITAHSHYAIKAIKLSAFDYLLKPLNKEELFSVLERLRKEKHQYNLHDRITALENSIEQKNNHKRLTLKTADKYVIVDIDDIIRLEADNAYTIFHTIKESNIIVSMPLNYFDKILSNHFSFFKVHRSHIINLNHVRQYVKSEGGYIQMINKNVVPLSVSRKKDFFNKLDV